MAVGIVVSPALGPGNRPGVSRGKVEISSWTFRQCACLETSTQVTARGAREGGGVGEMYDTMEFKESRLDRGEWFETCLANLRKERFGWLPPPSTGPQRLDRCSSTMRESRMKVDAAAFMVAFGQHLVLQMGIPKYTRSRLIPARSQLMQRAASEIRGAGGTSMGNVLIGMPSEVRRMTCLCVIVRRFTRIQA